MYENHESSCITRSSREVDSTNDEVATSLRRIDTLQSPNSDICCFSQKSQREFLKLPPMDLSSVMACYDDSYQKLKKRGEDIRMRLRCQANSKREMMEISRDITSLMADGEIFDKKSQKLFKAIKSRRRSGPAIDLT